MKRCPQCNFSFADSHDTCDFDGADLVDDPKPLPVAMVVSPRRATTQSPLLRLVKSPVFLIVLGLAGVLSSLLMMVYYDAARQPNSIAESRAQQDSPDSNRSPIPPTDAAAKDTTQPPSTSPNEVNTESSYPSPFGRGRVRVPTRRDSSRPRLRTSPSIMNQQTRPELARHRQPKDKSLQKESKESALQRDSKENPNRKESKLSAALKTTWNILKKPFKF